MDFKNLRAKKGNRMFGVHLAPAAQKTQPSKQIIIRAISEEKAQEIADLIGACGAIIEASDLFGTAESLRIFPIDKGFELTLDNYPQYGFGASGDIDDQLAVIMAKRASLSNKYVFAIYRLYDSMFLYSIDPIDLSPSHSENFKKPTYKDPINPKWSIRIANAIVLAYAAIEELNLQSLPKGKGPNGIWARDKQTGHWDAYSEKDLENRLRKSRIDVSDSFLWTYRGKRTLVERMIPRIPDKVPSYIRDRNTKEIRDREISIGDALENARDIRNKISAHRLSGSSRKPLLRTVSRGAKALSAYDATNIQHLARRLILESLGMLTLITRPH